MVIVLMLFTIILLSKKLVNWLEDRRRFACTTCGHEVLPTAFTCTSCKVDVIPKEILSWNILFGRRTPHQEETLAKEIANSHRLRLLSRGRCPNCAERVSPAEILKKGCGHCGFTFASVDYSDWFDDYRRQVIGRGVRMVLPLMLLSWIPALGIALAIVVVKIYITAPLRMFLGGFSKFGLKWGMRLFTLILLILGSFPFVSLLAVPILMLVHIWVYGNFAKKRITDGGPDAPTDQRSDVSNVQHV